MVDPIPDDSNADAAAADIDVVIVGAGAAGLACASRLAGRKVLVLERESRAGGRIHTLDLGRQRVDMGACFAFDPGLAPAGAAAPTGAMVGERQRMGVRIDDSIHWGATPLDCLARAVLDDASRTQIERFARGACDAQGLHGTRAAAVLDALLHQIHPGRLDEYDGAHQRDGLYAWFPDHWEHGNETLIDALMNHGEAQLQLDAEVDAVIEGADGIEVKYRSKDRRRIVRCRAAVIATTADVAASLVQWSDPRVRNFLAATRYASYVVVALAGTATPALAEFRALVSVSETPVLVMQQRTAGRDRAVLLCYYCGADVGMLASMPDAALVAHSRARLAAMGIAPAALDALYDPAVVRWRNAGTVLSSAYRQSRAVAGEPGSTEVILAGDYACASDEVGYGIADAVSSGVRAAQRVCAVLSH